MNLWKDALNTAHVKDHDGSVEKGCLGTKKGQGSKGSRSESEKCEDETPEEPGADFSIGSLQNNT